MEQRTLSHEETTTGIHTDCANTNRKDGPVALQIYTLGSFFKLLIPTAMIIEIPIKSDIDPVTTLDSSTNFQALGGVMLNML